MNDTFKKGVGIAIIASFAMMAQATIISAPGNNPWSTPAGYTFSANANAFTNGSPGTVTDYIGVANLGGVNPHANGAVAYNLGGAATIDSVTIYQIDAASRGFVTDWRAFYEGGYQDFYFAPPGSGSVSTNVMTFSSPVTSSFITVAPLNGQAGDGNRGFSQVQVNGTAPVTQRIDLASGKSFSMNSWANAFGTAAITTHNLLSADNNAAWNPTVGLGNNYLQVDLGATTNIFGFGVAQVGGGTGRSLLDQVRLEFSNDATFSSGVTFQNFSINNREYYYQADFSGMESARYVRLVAVSKFNNEDGNWGVYRFELFNSFTILPVPEPSTYLMTGLGLLMGFYGFRISARSKS